MTFDEYLHMARIGKTPHRAPDREPGIDDDRQMGESWAAYCKRKARIEAGKGKK